MTDRKNLITRLIFSIIVLLILITLFFTGKRMPLFLAIPIVAASLFFIVDYTMAIVKYKDEKDTEKDKQSGLYFKKSKKYDKIGGLPSGVTWL